MRELIRLAKKIIGTETVANPLGRSELSKKGLCDYVVNPASGCLHGCKFCYVPSTPMIRCRTTTLQERGVVDPQIEWGNYLFYREEIPGQLEAILGNRPKLKKTDAGRVW